MSNTQHYIFIDESGDPGEPFKIDDNGEKVPTGASLYYILTAICLDSKKLFALENGMMEIRNKYLFERINTKTHTRVKYITHVNSEYVNAMQLSDLVSGAIKDHFTGKNTDLRKIINKKYLYKIY